MKTLLWTAAILGASISSLAAQDESYVYVANGQGNSVDVRRPWGGLVTTLGGAPFNFNSPYDIVAVPSLDIVIVSNNTGGTLTVFNARTFAFILTVNLAVVTLEGQNLRGMSLSGDERELFVAGQRNLGATVVPAVYRVLLPSMTATLAAQLGAGGQLAEDCVVINASAVGGASGSAAGRVYFSVPAGNFVGVLNIDPPAALGSVSFAAGPLLNVNTPTQLERTPDHSAVFAACNTNEVIVNSQRVGRIQVNGNILTQPALRTGAIQNLSQVLDIAFRPDGRAYVIGSEDASSPDILEMDVNGNNLGMAPQLAGVTVAGRIRYDGTPPRLYVGEAGATSPNYGIRYATTQPTVDHRQQAASAAGPRAFAFLRNAAPLRISAIWPPGRVAGTGTVDILGSGFDPGATVAFIDDDTGATTGMAIDAASRSSTLLRVDSAGLAMGAYDVRVTNPGGNTFTLGRYYISLDPATVLTPSVVAVPSRDKGYSLVSVPQYLSAGDLLGAIGSQFGGYSPSSIRVFIQNGGSYLELNAAPSNFDLSNKSFWILSRDGGSLSLDGIPVGAGLQAVAEDDKIMVLEPGWNMVTQPTFNPVSGGGRYNMNGVSVHSDGALTVPAQSLTSSLIDTAALGLTSLPVRHQNGAYVFLTAADDMFSGVGYWIRNNTEAPLYLEFLTSDAVAKSLAVRSAAPAVAASEVPPAPPSGALEEDGGTSGCGLTGLEVLALLGLLRARGRRR